MPPGTRGRGSVWLRSTAELVETVVLGQTAALDIATFAPDRFSVEATAPEAAAAPLPGPVVGGEEQADAVPTPVRSKRAGSSSVSPAQQVKLSPPPSGQPLDFPLRRAGHDGAGRRHDRRRAAVQRRAGLAHDAYRGPEARAFLRDRHLFRLPGRRERRENRPRLPAGVTRGRRSSFLLLSRRQYGSELGSRQ